MNLSFKAKCSGCAALDMQGTEFVCKLGVAILCDDAGNQPQPNHEKCYKPATALELKQAKKLTSKATLV